MPGAHRVALSHGAFNTELNTVTAALCGDCVGVGIEEAVGLAAEYERLPHARSDTHPVSHLQGFHEHGSAQGNTS